MERESFAVAREKLEADDIAGAIVAFQDIRNTYPKEDIAEIGKRQIWCPKIKAAGFSSGL